jgi:O-antigen/teichoic acid export membrane protein
MKDHLANAAWGILDYAAYPVGMLLVAPIILHNMGAAQYGVWSVAVALVSMGSIIAAGFGDANIQHVASQRGLGQPDLVLSTVRCMISINLFLGTALACIAWVFAPYAALHIGSSPVTQRDCLWSLHLASILIWLRTMESVCISTQRAFARYGAAVRISLIARLLSLAAAAGLTYLTRDVAVMLAAAVVVSAVGVWLQFAKLRSLLHAESLWPMLDRAMLKALLGFGLFSWLQAVSGIIFGQADRLFLGISAGAVTVASYALCTQIAQPAYGIVASGLHFVFPHLAEYRMSCTPSELRRSVLTSFGANLLLVIATSLPLAVVGKSLLHAWLGTEAIAGASRLLLPIIIGSALLGMSVTATYALFALGHVRVVTWINLAGGAVMLALMAYLTPRLGAYGLAMARLSYGAITLLLYWPLMRSLRKVSEVSSAVAIKPAWEEL